MSSSSWIGSLNIDDFCKVQSLKERSQLQKQTASQLDQLKFAQVGVSTQLNMYSQLSSLLQTFQTSIKQLTDSFTSSLQVATSNLNTVTAQIESGGGVTAGTHTIIVSQLAQASSTASKNIASNSAALNLTNTITLGIGATSFNVNVVPTDSLDSIATKIKTNALNNKLGLSASVVSTGDGQYRLVVSSQQTGLANAVSISETGVGENALNLSTGVGGTGIVLMTANDAKFKLDSLEFQRSSNSNISVMGLNINLSGVSTDPTYLSVTESNQTNSVTTAAESMVTAYNQILSSIQQAQATITLPPADPSKNTAMPQDSTLTAVQSELQHAMGVGTSAYQILNSIGIKVKPTSSQTISLPNSSRELTFKVTGLLEINKDNLNGMPTLASTLASNASGLKSVLTDSSTGIMTNLDNLIKQPGGIWKALNDDKIGAISKGNKRLNSLNDQISDVNTRELELESNMIAKYANLEVSLTLLQNTSIYISQTVTMMTGGH